MTRLMVAALFALLLSSLDAQAQTWLGHGQQTSPVPADEMPRQVISSGPIGLLIELVNAEYELRASDHLTVGVGASRLAFGSDYTRENPYLNSDVFVRYYPSGSAFNGVNYGVKVGYTHLPHDGSYLGVGFDANHSVMLNRHFYASSGIGLKRLLRSTDGFALHYIPTLRLNIGVGF